MKTCLTCEGVIDGDDASCAHCGSALLDTRSVHAPVRRGDEDSHGPLVGRVVDGKYRVIGVLGRGGMGTVYRAVHEVSLIAVALKVLHPRRAARADFRAWFLAEARKAGRVVHEGTARVLDVGVAVDGTVYLAVELVDGQTLAEWLATAERFDPARIVDLLEQIAKAMAAAHSAGVVHRDLSPRNVMVVHREDRLVAKVLDFGIATQPPPSLRVEATRDVRDDSPTGFANPPYSAPEHLAGRSVDARADLYSLGVIAYEALSGELPVAGSSARELALATLAGELRPMRARAGVPRALQRLIAELVSLDPDDRPATASIVAERLRRIRQPRRRGLAALAIGALILSIAAVTLASAPNSVDPYLRVRAGPSSRSLSFATDGKVDVLRSSDLLDSRFDFGGFRSAELELVIERDRQLLSRRPLAPMLDVDGDVLSFGPRATEVAAELRLACADGSPVDLVFTVRGRAPIGHARVIVDDAAPVVALGCVRAPDAPDALRGDDVLELAATDVGGIARFALEVELLPSGSSRREVISFDLRPDSHGGAVRGLLASQMNGVRNFGRCELRVRARDFAGNEQVSASLPFGDLDLDAPEIVEIGGLGTGRVLVQDSAGASLRVTLSAFEPGLTLWARPPEHVGDAWLPLQIAAASGLRIDAVVNASVPGQLAPSGRWSFRLADPAGNTSEVVEEDLEIRGTDPSAELRPLSSAGRVGTGIAEFGDGLVADCGPWRLGLRVDPLYRPDRCTITRSDGSAATVRLDAVEAGSAQFVVEHIAGGDWQLQVSLYDDRRAARVDLPARALRVLDAPLVLRIPDAGDAEYLPELVDRAVVEVRDGMVAQGAAWELRPADARLVRGRVWTRVGTSFVARELGAPTEMLQPVLPPVSVGRGWNELFLELHDVLGRPVAVVVGEEQAEIVVGPGSESLSRAVRFFAHDAPLRPLQATAMLEFGQPLRMLFASELPPEPEFDWRLQIGAASQARSRRGITGANEEIGFDVPFEVAIGAAGLVGLGPEVFALGRDVPIDVRVSTPVGPCELRIQVRTIRTTLRALSLSDLAAGLPPDLAQMHFVPIPGPGVGRVFRDPVPRELIGRARFRTSSPIDVRNVPDGYLQDRELTRAQWTAIVRLGLARVATLREPERAAMVLNSDPLGLARLTAAALMPRDGVTPRRVVDGSDDDPIAGLDFHQASVIAKLLGLIVAQDSELFRLPLGVEMELAAFGPEPRADLALNGSAVRGPGIDAQRFRAGARQPATGPLAANVDLLRTLGDFVSTDLSDHVFGLDAGLREWVLDVPYLRLDAQAGALVLEWRADHARHLERALGTDPRAGSGATQTAVQHRAVVRGFAFGETDELDPGTDGRRSASWPGVVRELQLRRDGAGLVPNTVDPHLGFVGFRIAGGERFVARVRAR